MLTAITYRTCGNAKAVPAVPTWSSVTVLHQQQTYFPSGTPGCAWQPWQLCRNPVPSDGESNVTRRIPPLQLLLYHVPYACDASRCVLPCERSLPRSQASVTLHPECVDVYVPSERHVYYTIRRGFTHILAVYPMPSAVYALLSPSARVYISAHAMYRMPHPPIYV